MQSGMMVAVTTRYAMDDFKYALREIAPAVAVLVVGAIVLARRSAMTEPTNAISQRELTKQLQSEELQLRRTVSRLLFLRMKKKQKQANQGDQP
jgi:hypothetical protein